jgi:NADH:ubiquinone oxidoreductase subunit E
VINKTEITICLGSSCFSRGNKSLTHIINNYLHENNLEDKVIFKGARCFGTCENGPMIKINDKLFMRLTVDKLIEILKANIK